MPTYPGTHSSFDITKYSGNNRQAIRRIAEYFYVTRGFDPVDIGNSTYNAILVRPTDETSIYLNTERELIIVFADYDTFEIRTLEAFDSYYDLLELKRVDTSIRFIISNDDGIEANIAQYLQQNPEYPIIIPVTYTKLQRLANPLITAVRQNYVIRDLFGYQAPLRQEHFFFGRNDTVNTALDLAKSGQNSSLFGLRKSGKTSTIFAIRRKARAFGITAIQIDCQSPAVHARRYDELLSFVHNEIAKSTGQRPVKYEPGLSLVEVAERFSDGISQLLTKVKNNVLIVFDEIEQISPTTAASEHWRSGKDPVLFWQVLRSFYQTQAEGRLSVCIVGTSPNLLESSKINGIDNPVYLFAQKRFIRNLDYDEMKVMVSRLGHFMGLNFADQILSRLHTQYGGHPFFIRQVCSKIHQLASRARPVDVSTRLLAEAEDAFRSDLEVYLRDIVGNLQSLYPEEYNLLVSIVDGRKTEFIELAEFAPDLVDHLLGYGLVAKRGQDYDITLSAIAPAVNRLQKSFPYRDDRWAEINVRRNNLEQNIRATLYYWSLSVSVETWTTVIEKSLTKKNFENLETTEPGILFSKKSSPLYLTDLAGIIKNPNVLRHLTDRKSDISTNIFSLNSLRRDAHAKDFSDAEYQLACENLEALEREFSPP